MDLLYQIDGISSANVQMTLNVLTHNPVDQPGVLYYLFCTLYLGIVSLAGIALNFLYVVLFIKHRPIRNTMGMMYLNLCIADLIISISSLIKMFYVGLQIEMEAGRLMCTMFGFMTFIGGIQSMLTLMLVAIYRYSVVTNRCNQKQVCRPKLLTVLFILWIVGLVLAIGPIAGWNSYSPDKPAHWCTLNWHDRSLHGLLYLGIVFTLVFLVPVIVMTFCYLAILCKLKQIARNFGTSRSGQSSKAEKAVIRSSLIMALCFSLAWLPYALLALSVFIGLPTPELPYYIAIFPPMMCKMSPCINPLVYFRADPEVRKSLTSVREKIFGRSQSLNKGTTQVTVVRNVCSSRSVDIQCDGDVSITTFNPSSGENVINQTEMLLESNEGKLCSVIENSNLFSSMAQRETRI